MIVSLRSTNSFPQRHPFSPSQLDRLSLRIIVDPLFDSASEVLRFDPKAQSLKRVSSYPAKVFIPSHMASQDKGRPLPKFGEWDVNNPASAEGFTVIFNKARNDKKSSTAGGGGGVANPEPRPVDNTYLKHDTPKRKWFCCG